MSDITMWEIENSLYSETVQLICGVDEAGRGPLAGPVCAAAVILPRDLQIPGLTDSKKLTDKKRRELFPVIRSRPLPMGLALHRNRKLMRSIFFRQLSLLCGVRWISFPSGRTWR